MLNGSLEACRTGSGLEIQSVEMPGVIALPFRSITVETFEGVSG